PAPAGARVTGPAPSVQAGGPARPLPASLPVIVSVTGECLFQPFVPSVVCPSANVGTIESSIEVADELALLPARSVPVHATVWEPWPASDTVQGLPPEGSVYGAPSSLQ